MKIVFISNYFNHHQEPISRELFYLTNEEYFFIETVPMEIERIEMGWYVNEIPKYLIQSYKSKKAYRTSLELIDDADIVIIGSASDKYIKNRIKQGKLIFRYSERPLKSDYGFIKYLFRYYKWHKKNPKKSNNYLLCASAYTSSDYAKFGLFLNKALKWGYFPKVKKYENINQLIDNKSKNSIIWVARFIDCKHPEIVCTIGEKLLQDGYDFELYMIGDGVLFEGIKLLIKEKKLDKNIKLLGSMKYEEVRKYFEKSEIHLFTSDKKEGWGAVLNESMNSACVPIASHIIGSVPYLINDGINGFIYQNGNIENLYNKLIYLLNNKNELKKMSRNAYRTINDNWSPKNAAERLIEISEAILKNNHIDLYGEGPCSKAQIISDDWINRKKE